MKKLLDKIKAMNKGLLIGIGVGVGVIIGALITVLIVLAVTNPAEPSKKDPADTTVKLEETTGDETTGAEETTDGDTTASDTTASDTTADTTAAITTQTPPSTTAPVVTTPPVTNNGGGSGGGGQPDRHRSGSPQDSGDRQRGRAHVSPLTRDSHSPSRSHGLRRGSFRGGHVGKVGGGQGSSLFPGCCGGTCR